MKKVVALMLILVSCKTRPFNDASTVLQAGSTQLMQGDQLDVNDISILYPLPTTKEEALKAVGLEAKGPLGSLLPRDMFGPISKRLNEVKNSSNGTGELPDAGDLAYERWRISSVRFDPCFPRVEFDISDASCRPQIRLVAMPLKFVNSSNGITTFFEDQALHMLYEPPVALRKEERKKMLDELVRLKNKHASIQSANPTLGYPLSIHPAFKNQSDGDFARDVKEFILKFCGKDRLVHVAQMQTVSVSIWNFFAMNVVDGKLKTIPIATLKGNAAMQTSVGGGGRFGLRPEGINPASYHGINTEVGFMDDADAKKHVIPTEFLNNPFKSNVGNVDCASCHQAQNIDANLIDKKLIPTPLSPVAGATMVVARQAGSSWQVHNFNWSGISKRAVNESAVIASVLNKKFLGLNDAALKQNYKAQEFCFESLPFFDNPIFDNDDSIFLEGQTRLPVKKVNNETAFQKPGVILNNAGFKKRLDDLLKENSQFQKFEIGNGANSSTLFLVNRFNEEAKKKAIGFWYNRKAKNMTDVYEVSLDLKCNKMVGTAVSLTTGEKEDIGMLEK